MILNDQRENDAVVKPFKEDLAKKDHEITNLENKIAKMKDAAVDEHNRFLEFQGVLEVGLKAAKVAMEFSQTELKRTTQVM